MSASVLTLVMREIMVVHNNALPLRLQTCERRLMLMQPMLTGLETTCMSSSRYYKVADRVWEQAVLSKHVRQCNVFLVAKSNTCRHNALPAAATNMRMTTDDDATDADWTRDDLCVDVDVL